MTALERLRARMAERGVEAMLITSIGDVAWLTGFTGSFGQVFVTPDRAVFITDSRYAIQAADEVRGMDLVTFGSPRTAGDAVRDVLAQAGATRVAFETAMTYREYLSLRDKLEGIELVPVEDLVMPLRLVKSPEEIDKIRRACGLADACMEHAFRMIQPGVAEYDIGLDIEFFIRRNKAELGFAPIVVSGPNSARPHGRPSERRLAEGDFVTLDLGACLEGYCSDITRTVVVGHASPEHVRVYTAVKNALEAALEALRPGVDGREVDGKAREVLRAEGLDQYFGHGLGHGLGRAVHDGGRLSSNAEQRIEPGQVWTVEPGVYIEGFGGVRIEEDVLVTETGIEVLTKTPRELTILPR